MSRIHVITDSQTGERTEVPFTAEEEAEADAKDAVVSSDAAKNAVEKQRVNAVKTSARRQALVTAIRGSDDLGVISYVNTKVTDLASAKVLLTDLTLLVAGVIRN